MAVPAVTRVRLVALASGGGRTVANLHAHCADGRLDADIVLVVASRADAGVVERCRALGLPCLVVGPSTHADRARREHALLGAIFEARPDWVLLCGWLQLLPIPAELEGRVLNVHPALLPAYGGRGYYGRRVHEAVARDGVPVSGCTIHFATARYDEGPQVLQEAVPLDPGDDADAVADKVFAAECRAYPEALAHLIAGRARWVDGAVRWDWPLTGAAADPAPRGRS